MNVYEEMLRKIVVNLIDFARNGALQEEHLNTDLDEACKLLGINRRLLETSSESHHIY